MYRITSTDVFTDLVIVVDTRRNQYTSASELAQMAVCERQVLLRAKMGDRKTARQEVAAKWGNSVHDQIHREGHTPSYPQDRNADKRCFIATAVYGLDAPETTRLRRFRDEALIGNPLGKMLVALYYGISPPIARMLDHNQHARGLIKWALDAVVRAIK